MSAEPTPRRGDLMLMGRMAAGVELLGRTGVREVEIAYDDDLRESRTVQWWAGGLWQGVKVHSYHFPYPAHAVEDLVGQVVNGGGCAICERTTVVGLEVAGYCCFTLHADDVDEPQHYEYLRTCERETFAVYAKRLALPRELRRELWAAIKTNDAETLARFGLVSAEKRAEIIRQMGLVR